MFNLRVRVGFLRSPVGALFVGIGLLAVCFVNSAWAVPAFPGAMGYGANATGGRSGDVFHVTSLTDDVTSDDYDHSLRYGIASATGPRTIVFDVSGMIELTDKLVVNKSNITIAGQTAPGQGICLKNWTFEINANDVVVRHIRSRLGIDAGVADDCVTIAGGDNIILDHVSASWSVDEVLSVKEGATTVHATVQNSFIVEALNNSIHPKGAHSYGSLIKPGVDACYTWYGNLYADNWSRNPRPGNDNNETLLLDFRNNVVYDWNDQAGYTEDDGSGVLEMNYVGNYAIVGPAGTKKYIFNGKSLLAAELKIYQPGSTSLYANKMDANKNGVLDGNTGTTNGWSLFTNVSTGSRMTTEFALDPNYPAMTTLSADDALDMVVTSGGAFFWNRDTADANVVAQVLSYGTSGAIYDTVEQAGGWPTYEELTRAADWDTDQDGMPNWWELAHGLDPNDANDRNDYDLNRLYTNLEDYINAVPEPTTVGLLTVGVLGLLRRRRS